MRERVLAPGSSPGILALLRVGKPAQGRYARCCSLPSSPCSTPQPAICSKALKRWKGGLPSDGQVRYRERWPGIELVSRGQGGRLQYELIVKPGADPRQIRLAYSGSEEMSGNDARSPIQQIASGELRDGRLYADQEIVRKAGGSGGRLWQRQSPPDGRA